MNITQHPPDSRSIQVVATLAVAATAGALDQLSKWMVVAMMVPERPLVVIPGFLDLQLRGNPHGAFGLFASFPASLRLPTLLALSILAMLAVVTFSIRTLGRSKLTSVSLGLILGGALSNLIDRAVRGEVLDFLDVHLGNQAHWPTFNLADAAITAGSLILVGVLFHSWLKKKNQSERN